MGGIFGDQSLEQCQELFKQKTLDKLLATRVVLWESKQDLGDFLVEHEAKAVCELLGEVATHTANLHSDKTLPAVQNEP